ncbi:sorcin-like [Acanthaster planci]|uniref:Sorcin-like n=1 Tax=Acanthaster planci TaxID=133434 RepID=A0A8B7Z541_ACAPL|nr:sorcin-like [Acanthaster planci]
MAYPGYGAGPVAPPQQDPLYGWFQAVAGVDGQIEPVELQQCLTSSGIAGTYQQFSLETCRVMIAMLDRDYSGKMGFSEFKELWTVINQWKQTFIAFDSDRSGTIDGHELANAIRSFGYNLTPSAVGVLLKRYEKGGRITFDDFVSCAVRLRALTAIFQSRDAQRNGWANFQYDDFIRCTMSI